MKPPKLSGILITPSRGQAPGFRHLIVGNPQNHRTLCGRAGVRGVVIMSSKDEREVAHKWDICDDGEVNCSKCEQIFIRDVWE